MENPGQFRVEINRLRAKYPFCLLSGPLIGLPSLGLLGIL